MQRLVHSLLSPRRRGPARYHRFRIPMAVRCAAIWLAALAVIDFALTSNALDEYDGDFGDLMDLDGLADSGGGLDGFGDLGHLSDYDHNEDEASCGHVPGWASLDDITFDKIVQGDTRAAVLFWDKTSPLEYESLQVAAELGLHENLLLIRVNKDDSPMLVARYKLKTIPRLMFLPGGGRQPLEFFGELTEAEEQLAWLEAKAGRPQELPGLVELVAKLAAADSESGRREAAQAVEEAAALLTGYAARTGELYTKVARKVAKQGLPYLQAEYDRVHRLLTEEALAPGKVEQFKRKLSVLKVYARQGGITIKEVSTREAKGDVAADKEDL